MDEIQAAAIHGQTNPVLIKYLHKALDEPAPRLRAARWNSLLELMRPEDAAAVFAIFPARDQKGQWFMDEGEAFWQQWGRIDLKAALASGRMPGQWTQQLYRGFARGCSYEEAAAAIPQPGGKDRSAILRGVIQGISERDPSQAYSLLNAHASPAERRGLISEIAFLAVAKDGLEGAETWLAPVTQNSLEDARAAFGILCESARHGNRETSSAFILRHVDKPYFEPGFVSQIITSYGGAEPKEALDFAGRLPARLSAVDGLSRLINKCVSKDPDMVGLWLRENRQAAGYDAIVQAYAASIESLDPEAAARWRGTIKDSVLAVPPSR